MSKAKNKKCGNCKTTTPHSNTSRCKICGTKKPKKYAKDDTSYADRACGL